MLRIVPIQDKRAMRTFIALPWSIYRDDPVWIPPLLLERRQQLSPRNPYFQHARWNAWLAIRDERPVGRISAQIDELHLQRYADATGFFGMLEAEDDAEVFALLLDTARAWLHEQGMQRVRGPFNLSINEECGLLVEGYDRPPMFMMGHSPPYYVDRVEEQGFVSVKELVTYCVAPDFVAPKEMKEVSEKLARRGRTHIRLRPLNRKRIKEELELLREIFNDAWARNWGFVPFTQAEFELLGLSLKPLIDDDFVQIAEVGGEAAGMIVAMPNINEAIRDLNGRLLPFGWAKLLWRLKVSYPKTARVALMGVRARYQRSLISSTLSLALIEAVRGSVCRRGIREVEMGWILEDNTAMRNIIEAIGGSINKRYRVYERTCV